VLPRIRTGVLGCLMVAAMACGGGGAPEEYSPSHRAEFVEDCRTSAVSEAVCGCFYDRLAAELPFARFEELDEQLQTLSGELPADLATWAAACAADPPSDGDA
jgi:hypothetical protein